jgi:hypothetical protein
MRLMRAYASIQKPRMKRALVALAEQIGGKDGGHLTSRQPVPIF